MSRKEQHVFDQHELAAAHGAPDHAALLIASWLGPRPSEYLALKWSDLDLPAGTMTVVRTIAFASKARRAKGAPDWAFADTKTKASRRTIPLPATIIDALTSHRKSQAEVRLKAGKDWQDNGLVFPDALGHPQIPHTFGPPHGGAGRVS